MMNFSETVAPGLQDFFFRSADRMRVEGCVNAIAQEGLSLVLSSSHEALLDHYVAMLLTRLRQQAPEHRLEVYFPANTESLIARFNEALAAQSVQDAVKPGAPGSGAQIWIVHDAQKLPDHEMQLLARLIQNFPGANIRTLLIMNGQSEREALAALGRKVLRWDIEPPTAEQAEAALEQARQDGRFNAVSQLLRRMGRLPEPAQDPATLAPVTPPPGEVPSGETTALSGAGRWRAVLEPLGALPRIVRTALRRHIRPIGIGLLLLAVSAGAALWLQSSRSSRAGTGTPADSASAMAKSATAESPAPSAAALASEPASAASAVPASGARPTSSTDTPTAPPTAVSSKSAVETELPESTAQAQRWARGLQGKAFLVQHGSRSSYEAAVQLKNSHPVLDEARIVAFYRPGESLARFAVITGPYPSADAAAAMARRTDVPRTSWVRVAQDLQSQLEPAGKTPGART